MILFERSNRPVATTPAGEAMLEHARRALAEVALVEAKSSADQLPGPLRLGVIPALAPYSMPLILGPLRKAHPAMTIELWEDVTVALAERLRTRRLDAAILATEAPKADLKSVKLFEEPFLAAAIQGASPPPLRAGRLAEAAAG